MAEKTNLCHHPGDSRFLLPVAFAHTQTVIPSTSGFLGVDLLNGETGLLICLCSCPPLLLFYFFLRFAGVFSGFFLFCTELRYKPASANKRKYPYREMA
jgi:hypothetical protein